MKYVDLYRLQDELNEKSTKSGRWKQVRYISDHCVAAIAELMEMMESMDWKWWKKNEVDTWNVKIEAIDAVHFLISMNILKHATDGEELQLERVQGSVSPTARGRDSEEVRSFFFRAVNMVTEIYDTESPEPMHRLIEDVLGAAGITAEEFEAIYLAKYCLNEIRWEGGYLLGTYTKHKEGGLEDNYYLEEVVRAFKGKSDIDKDVVMEVLKDVLEAVGSMS